MSILITGGAGFIGSNYVRYLVNAGEGPITVLDALTYAGNLANISDLITDGRIRFVRGDIRDRETVRSAMDGCNEVVHFAAESHVDRSLLDPDVFISTNVLGTNVLCATARDCNVERFVHISTDEVYGSIDAGSFFETDRLAPRSPYSSSKAGSDLVALSYFETYDLPVIVTRSSNQFGPFQFPEKLIPLFVTNLMRGQKVPLYGTGANVRDWLFVEDNCRAVDLVRRHGVVGEVYNIGGGNEMTNLDLTHRILEAFGEGSAAILHVEDRVGHDRRYSIDCSKVSALGWRPEVGFE